MSSDLEIEGQWGGFEHGGQGLIPVIGAKSNERGVNPPPGDVQVLEHLADFFGLKGEQKLAFMKIEHRFMSEEYPGGGGLLDRGETGGREGELILGGGVRTL